MSIKFGAGILKPTESVMVSLATVGAVYGIYQLNVGTVSQVHMTDANHPAPESSRKKAGYTALVLVAGLTLVTRNVNVGILGGGTIIAMELSYRHAIMVHPATGKMVPPGNSVYDEPRDNNVVPISTATDDITGTYGY